MLRTQTMLLGALVALGGAGAACADPGLAQVDAAMDVLFRTQSINQVAVSPDGRHLAWVLPRAAVGMGPPRLRLHIGNLDMTGGRRATSEGDGGPWDEREIAWSPDGSRIAFLSDRDSPGQLELCVLRADGGEPERLTDLKGVLTRPQWSPDGSKISVRFAPGTHGILGAGAAGAPPDGEVHEEDFPQYLMAVDLRTHAVRQVTPPGLVAFESDWSPDSRRLVFTAAPPPGDDTWYHACLYTVGAEGGAIRRIYEPRLQIAVPRWSPDGTEIAFIEGLMSDKGSTGGDVCVVPADGGTARNLTAAWRTSPAWFQWQPGSRRLLISELHDAGVRVSTVDAAGGPATNLWSDFGVVGSGEDHLSPRATDVLSLSVAADGKTSAVIRSFVDRPPEVWTGPIGAWTQRSHFNAAIRPTWGRTENVHWRSGPWNVGGWLVYPAGYDPSRRYPLIVSVHGGPANQLSAAWPAVTGYDLAILSSAGYFVFCPEARGSYGQGEAFTRANAPDYGFGPLADILAGVDHLLEKLPIDPARIGIVGGSYGGYMTMFAVTQTGRFHAAVAASGMSDMTAEYGQTFIEQWMPVYFGGKPWEVPDTYRRLSAIAYVDRVTTPTLIIAGAGDKECPAAQSLELWHDLSRRGVPSRLVIYSGEGHGPRSREHIMDRIDRTAAWFQHYLQ